jgi:hypothetical protein
LARVGKASECIEAPKAAPVIKWPCGEGKEMERKKGVNLNKLKKGSSSRSQLMLMNMKETAKISSHYPKSF